MAKNSYNFAFVYMLNGSEITEEEAISHIIKMQEQKKEYERRIKNDRKEKGT